MTVIEFKPKGRRKKVTMESALAQVLESKPRELMIIADSADGKEVLFFHTGEAQERALWLLEQIKVMLISGELEE